MPLPVNDDRTLDVLAVIIAFKAKHDGLAPSAREIIQLCTTNITSVSMVHYYLNRLERAGRIRQLRDPHGRRVARGIFVVNGRWVPPSSPLSART